MAVLEIAPITSRDHTRRSLTTPTGDYYCIGTPSVLLAEELVLLGIRRVVFTAREAEMDWDIAESILENAGIEISASWESD